MRHRAALTYRHIRIKLAATSTEEPACLAIYAISDEPMSAEEWKKQYVRDR